MTDTMLEQAQRLVDQLTPHDQVRLLAYLASRLAQAVPAPQAPRPGAPAPADAWEAFFQLGEELATSDTPERETLTAAVLAMRR
jgi:hypothetical protein